MLSLPTENMEQPSESTNLYIRSLGLRDLGPYTCQAYNGLGPAVSSSTVLKALGPIALTGSREDDAYRPYVVDAPRAPGTPPIYR
jgi:papilin